MNTQAIFATSAALLLLASPAVADETLRARVQETGLLKALRSERGLLITDRLTRSMDDLDRALASVGGAPPRAETVAVVPTVRTSRAIATSTAEAPDPRGGAGREAASDEALVPRKHERTMLAAEETPAGIEARAAGCYERSLRGDAGAGGRLEVALRFDARATVTEAAVHNDSTDDESLRSCVVEAVIDAVTGRPTYADSLVTMAFDFRPR